MNKLQEIKVTSPPVRGGGGEEEGNMLQYFVLWRLYLKRFHIKIKFNKIHLFSVFFGFQQKGD